MKSQVVLKKQFDESSESQEKISKTKSNKNNSKPTSRNSLKDNKNMNITYSALNQGNQNISTNSEIFDLIESLHQKIKIYEQEIGSLIDEKIQMQMTISKLQFANIQNNQIETNELNEANKTNEINNQLNSLNNKIERQKGILDRDYSILNETINDSVFNHKTGRNLQSDILNKEKENIVKDIKELKEEMNALVELQKKIDENFENDLNLDVKSEKSFKTIQHANENISNHEDKMNSNDRNFPNNINLSPAATIPNIDRYFVLNGKISLIDSENNLWHLTKCHKYDNSRKNNNLRDKEKFLNDYLANYQRISNEKQSNINQIDEVNNIKPIEKETIQKIEEDPMTAIIKQNKSQFDSNIINNLTTINTNRNSEKNYDSLGLNNETEIKLDSKDDQLISDDSGLNLNLDNNSSLILSESD